MKYLLAALVLFLLPGAATAQVFAKKQHQLGVALNTGEFDTNFQQGAGLSHSRNGMAGLSFSWRYNLLNEVGAGLNFRLRTINRKEQVLRSSFHALFLSSYLQLINAKRVGLGLGLHYGPAFLNQRYLDRNKDTRLSARGFNYTADLTFTILPGNNTCFSIGLGLSSYPLVIHHLSIDQGANLAAADNYLINYTGGELLIGISRRL